jgi:membrane-bound metal-dependent hydrolase YbcI (DUF457 family)
MFNTTHTLVGLAIARTGADARIRYAAATAVIASNLPDIDILTALWGTPAYVDHHRGITHALIGIPALALLLSAVIRVFAGGFRRIFALALIAMATHPLLDFANNYGWRPFAPFNDTWLYGDVLFIIDPYIDAILLAGIIAGRLKPGMRRLASCVSLGLVLFYVAGRIELHHLAAVRFAAVLSQKPGVEKWAVLPGMLNPFVWQGMFQTGTETGVMSVHALRGPEGPVESVPRGPGGLEPAALARAAGTPSAAILLRFARFLVVRGGPTEAGYRIAFLDYRFYGRADGRTLGSEVMLDASGSVTKETLSFRQSID